MKRSTWWMLGGIVSLVGGAMALFDPFAGTLAVTALAAWVFLVLGFLELVAVFAAPGTGSKIWLGLLGALSIWIGISLIGNPLAGMMTLTLVVAFAILASGIVRLVASFAFTGSHAFWMMLLSAVISIVLGVMILSNYPESAASILGIFLGVELIFGGISLISLSRTAKKIEGVWEA